MAPFNKTEVSRLKENSRIKPWCPVTVEPLLAVFMAAYSMTSPTLQQYIYDIQGNGTLQNTSTCDVNVTDPAYQRQLKAQAETSQWVMYLTLAMSVPSAVFTVVLGAVSDKLGRKVMLIVPAFGSVLCALTGALVIHFSLPLQVLLAGNILSGVMGGWTALFGGCFAYVADITDAGKQRTIRVALLQSMLAVSVVGGEIGAGYWIRDAGIPLGFNEVYWFIVGCYTVCLLYPLMLTETRPNVDDHALFSCSHFRSFVKVFREERYEGRRRKLYLYVLAYLLTNGCAISASNLVVLYALGSPFCFTPNLVGLVKAAHGIVPLTSFFGIMILHRCLSEFSLMMIAFVSFIGGLVLLAFAGDFEKPTVVLFIVPVVMMLRMMTPPIIKTILSRIVKADEQGTLFAVLLSMDSVGSIIFSVLFNNIYSSTVGLMRGLVFLVAAGILTLTAGLVGIIQYYEPNDGYESLSQGGENREIKDIQ